MSDPFTATTAPPVTKKMDVSPSWKKVIQNKTHGLDKPTYLSIATVDEKDSSPLNEIFVYRGFAGEDKHGETGWQSDLLTSTCDKRSFNVADNATFVATWVVNDDHFRILGKAHALGQEFNSTDDIGNHIVRKRRFRKSHKEGDNDNSSDDEDDEESLGDKVSSATKSFLRRIKSRIHHGGSSRKFDWEAERLRQWHDLSDEARASFTWPTASGQPKVDEGEEDLEARVAQLEIGDTDAEGHFTHEDKDKQALLERGYENFVVVFLEVLEIDHQDLGQGQRTIYHRDGIEWKTTSVTA
ncbi:hypothetical protein BDA99DRAFT_530576 [Phascolomyces articulosus]|uniref:Pyridoxamine 5'-phosphate oxidase Alr4036 family FMN-binding domain-containing protein n=1 Tax=Phascolomyces articulosus TaxID=60185 RepID=A0AAD5P8A4_9FUNG|nr:hypothetical protein BDA99DRAFT_530576 [Phascolomyces articulosus]